MGYMYSYGIYFYETDFYKAKKIWIIDLTDLCAKRELLACLKAKFRSIKFFV